MEVLDFMFDLPKDRNKADNAEEDEAEDEVEAEYQEHGKGAAPNSNLGCPLALLCKSQFLPP
jgi:hypothetical protein